MMNTSKFSVEKAHNAQLQLSKKIISEDQLPEKIQLVAGVDVAYAGNLSIGAVAVLDYNSLALVETRTHICQTQFPYIPTLLSFRELRPVVLSLGKLHTRPDVFLVDGQGYAHPYRCGFACHLGVVIGRPTIGVAKSRLFGNVDEPERRGVAFLKHKGEVIGARLTVRDGCRPVYVSVGHMISLDTAIRITRHCIRCGCIPEPILKAHQTATVEKRKINNVSKINV
jgi:deoxyribonuclease V